MLFKNPLNWRLGGMPPLATPLHQNMYKQSLNNTKHVNIIQLYTIQAISQINLTVVGAILSISRKVNILSITKLNAQ